MVRGGIIGKQRNRTLYIVYNIMLNWFIHGGLYDMSQQVGFLIAQILAVFIGVVSLGAILYALFKLHLKND